MIEKVRDFYEKLTEELKYHEGLKSHKRGLETTLWGLEEQARFPEYSAKGDQQELNDKLNLLRVQIGTSDKLIDSHLAKVIEIIKSFKV